MHTCTNRNILFHFDYECLMVVVFSFVFSIYLHAQTPTSKHAPFNCLFVFIQFTIQMKIILFLSFSVSHYLCVSRSNVCPTAWYLHHFLFALCSMSVTAYAVLKCTFNNICFKRKSDKQMCDNGHLLKRALIHSTQNQPSVIRHSRVFYFAKQEKGDC